MLREEHTRALTRKPKSAKWKLLRERTHKGLNKSQNQLSEKCWEKEHTRALTR